MLLRRTCNEVQLDVVLGCISGTLHGAGSYLCFTLKYFKCIDCKKYKKHVSSVKYVCACSVSANIMYVKIRTDVCI